MVRTLADLLAKENDFFEDKRKTIYEIYVKLINFNFNTNERYRDELMELSLYLEKADNVLEKLINDNQDIIDNFDDTEIILQEKREDELSKENNELN